MNAYLALALALAAIAGLSWWAIARARRSANNIDRRTDR